MKTPLRYFSGLTGDRENGLDFGMLPLSNSRPLRVRSSRELIVRFVILMALGGWQADQAWHTYTLHWWVRAVVHALIAVLCGAAGVEVFVALGKNRSAGQP